MTYTSNCTADFAGVHVPEVAKIITPVHGSHHGLLLSLLNNLGRTEEQFGLPINKAGIIRYISQVTGL